MFPIEPKTYEQPSLKQRSFDWISVENSGLSQTANHHAPIYIEDQAETQTAKYALCQIAKRLLYNWQREHFFKHQQWYSKLLWQVCTRILHNLPLAVNLLVHIHKSTFKLLFTTIFH